MSTIAEQSHSREFDSRELSLEYKYRIPDPIYRPDSEDWPRSPILCEEEVRRIVSSEGTRLGDSSVPGTGQFFRLLSGQRLCVLGYTAVTHGKCYVVGLRVVCEVEDERECWPTFSRDAIFGLEEADSFKLSHAAELQVENTLLKDQLYSERRARTKEDLSAVHSVLRDELSQEYHYLKRDDSVTLGETLIDYMKKEETLMEWAREVGFESYSLERQKVVHFLAQLRHLENRIEESEANLSFAKSFACSMYGMKEPPKVFVEPEDYPDGPAVYFLWDQRRDECVYVGKAVNVRNRLRSHEKLRDWMKVSFIEMPEEDIHTNELFYIWLLKPPLNSESKFFYPEERILELTAKHESVS